MLAKDLRNKNRDELKKILLESKGSLEKYMHDVYKGKEKDVSKTSRHRKDLARIKTVLAEKKFLEEEKND